ncbi:MAG: phosphoglycerate dehydrogenase [Propionibacteriaceae bacterium]|nr:phosphoglycerate dehydrogenase [Propionibacteriaceae bacterium]
MKALLLENIHPDAVTILEAQGFEVETRAGSLSANELVAALQGVSLLGIRSNTKVTTEIIKQLNGSLLAIGCFCIGTNQVDTNTAAGRGIAVFNAPYSNTRSVVELAMAEIVVLARHLTDRNQQMHEGTWVKSATGSHEVRGRTLGIVGYGNIGSQLSVLAESYGMRVIYYDIADKLALGNAKRCATLDELLEQSDVVSLHVDGRNTNSGLIDETALSKMRQRSFLLNLSRGSIVDLGSLARHLRSGHLAGAAIDVFPTEPKTAGDPFIHELQGIPNVILTPHVGGSTQEAQVDIGHYVAHKLLDYVQNGSTLMSVNLPNVGAPERAGHRILHIHRNIPGVLAKLNALLAGYDANIAFQSLSTSGEIGYVVTDVAEARRGLTEELRAMPETIRVRVIR